MDFWRMGRRLLENVMEFNNQSLDQFIKEHDMYGYDIGKKVVLILHYQVIIKDLIENIWQGSRARGSR